MEEEERNTRELNANILAKEKAAADEKSAAVATKVAVSTVDLGAQRRQEANRLKVQKRIAKAEKRAKGVAERRMFGGTPMVEGDEVATAVHYLHLLALHCIICSSLIVMCCTGHYIRTKILICLDSFYRENFRSYTFLPYTSA
jgi:hypothetical protein